jgi:UV DNA damage repair endonuclease
MIFGHNQTNISYLGIPKKSITIDKRICSYEDILDLILALCIVNSKISSKIVCLNLSELDITDEFMNDDLIEEENPLISEKINDINSLVNKNSMRVVIFIGKDYFLGSQLDAIRIKTVKLLNKLSDILDVIGMNGPSMVIRIGSAYGNRKKTMKEFCLMVAKLKGTTIQRLAVMNDEKPSLFSITDLLSGVYYETGIPLCFRILPHQFNDGGLSIREAMFLAASTWNVKTKPFFFHSESSDVDSNGKALSPNCTDLLTMRIPTFGLDIDVIIDSPNRELCYLEYLKSHRGLPPTIINKISKK